MTKNMEKNNFEEIYNKTYTRMLKFAVVKSNNIDDVNDIIQDTYIELLKIMKKKKVILTENLENYVLGIANNVYSIFSRMHMNSKDNFDYTTAFMLKEIKGNYDKKHIYSEILSDSSNLEIIEANSEDRTITTNFTVRAKDSFPKSKKIYIRIFDLGYTMVDTSEKDGITKIESTEDFVLSDAEWRFEIDVPDKFYERDTIELKLEKDIPELEIEKITLTEVGLVVNFKSKEYYDLIMNGKDMGAEKIQELSKEMLNITNGEGKVYQELSVGTTGEKEGFKITYDAGKVDLNKKLFINFKINDIQYTSELIEK